MHTAPEGIDDHTAFDVASTALHTPGLPPLHLTSSAPFVAKRIARSIIYQHVKSPSISLSCAAIPSFSPRIDAPTSFTYFSGSLGSRFLRFRVTLGFLAGFANSACTGSGDGRSPRIQACESAVGLRQVSPTATGVVTSTRRKQVDETLG